jgi:alcohol dehydrogenase class IV
MSAVWSYLSPVEVLFGEGAVARLAERVQAPSAVVVTNRRLAVSGLEFRGHRKTR